MIELLVGLRTEMAERRVKPTPVVECLDGGERVSSRLVAGAVATVMRTPTLERADDALRRGTVVPATEPGRADFCMCRLCLS
jgi:hypothetical protein